MELRCQIMRAPSPRARCKNLSLGSPAATSSRFSPTVAKPYSSRVHVMASKSIVSVRRPAVSRRHVVRDTDGPKSNRGRPSDGATRNRGSSYSPARTGG